MRILRGARRPLHPLRPQRPVSSTNLPQPLHHHHPTQPHQHRHNSWWTRAIASANGTDLSTNSDPSDNHPRTRAEIMAETLLRGPPPKIHILGTGNIGCLIAHSLRGLHPKPPVTLLVHRRAMLEDFESMGRVINVEMERLNVSRRGYDIELSNKHIEGLLPRRQYQTHQNINSGPRPGHIEHLIVTTKSHQTRVALEPLVDRLGPTSTIAFIQNGMGVVEEMNTNFWPNPENRPNYIMGVTTHGVSAPRDPYQPFTVIRNGIGTLMLGIPPSDPFPGGNTPYTSPPSPPSYSPSPPSSPSTNSSSHPPQDPQDLPPLSSLPPSTSYLLTTLTSAPGLVGTYIPPGELLTIQLEKLVLNSIINPLTTIFNIPNGALLHNYSATKVIKLLLYETSQLILSLPELQHIQNLDARFSEENLYAAVVRLARNTEANWSSMVQDVRLGRTTEVDYINGWIVKRGLELGRQCAVNYMVTCMVRAREKMAKVEKDAEVPFEGLNL